MLENRMSPEDKNSQEPKNSQEANKALGRRIVEALNTGNLAIVDEIVAAGYVDRTPFPGATPDREGFKQGLSKFRAGFPDLRYTINDEIAVGDRLVHRLTGRATQRGEYLGVPATGKQATWSEIHIARVVDGKLVEHWGVEDQFGMLEQLGLVSKPTMPVPATAR